MGVDTHIYLPAQTRLCDVASVVATLLGHPTKLANHDKYQSCDVVGVRKEGIVELAGCANIILSYDEDVCSRCRTAPGYRSILYQYESSGRNGSGANGEHVILIRSTPLNIALGVRLVEFFGGAVNYQDCDDKIDIEIPPRRVTYPEDGTLWTDFEKEKSEVKALTIEEIEECKNFSAYEQIDLASGAPWLAKPLVASVR